jgi:hypothetical protein
METKLQESRLKGAVHFHQIVPFLLDDFPGSLGCCTSIKMKRKLLSILPFETRGGHCHADDASMWIFYFF